MITNRPRAVTEIQVGSRILADVHDYVRQNQQDLEVWDSSQDSNLVIDEFYTILRVDGFAGNLKTLFLAATNQHPSQDFIIGARIAIDGTIALDIANISFPNRTDGAVFPVGAMIWDLTNNRPSSIVDDKFFVFDRTLELAIYMNRTDTSPERSMIVGWDIRAAFKSI